MENIARVCDNVYDLDDPKRNSPQHIETLDRLERSLVHAKQYVEDGDEPKQDNTSMQIAELYRLAGLVYLYRAGKSLPPTNIKVRTTVAAGFKIAATLISCTRAFPLVILGCEARTDAERLVLMDLVRRTQAHRKIGNIVGAQRLIEAAWAQDDLCAGDGEVDYVRKLDAVVRLSRFVPSFV
jgi:hypothetical protein